jgi:hypothetical protein
MTAWRTRQLARAGRELAEAQQVVASAACVQPLVETAAASWADAKKVGEAWQEMKLAGGLACNPDAFNQRNGMIQLLNQVTLGSKVDDRAPELKEAWGRVQRSNVLGQVEKLGRAAGGSLQNDYQWLCNTGTRSPSVVHSGNRNGAGGGHRSAHPSPRARRSSPTCRRFWADHRSCRDLA